MWRSEEQWKELISPEWDRAQALVKDQPPKAIDEANACIDAYALCRSSFPNICSGTINRRQPRWF
jgi:hypothetical protein